MNTAPQELRKEHIKSQELTGTSEIMSICLSPQRVRQREKSASEGRLKPSLLIFFV